MKHLDYITYEDVDALTDEEFTAFRNYLKFIGNRVNDELGMKHSDFYDCILFLNGYGNLTWMRASWLPNTRLKTRLSLEEVKRMAALGMHSCK